MGESSELKIIITADDKAGKVLSQNKKQLLDLGDIAGGALKLGLGLAAGGATTLAAGLITSVKAASDAADIQADLDATLQSTKFAAGLTAAEINNMATRLSEVTRFEDDTIVSGQAMLLTFTNIGKDVFPAATEAMLNLTQKFGSMDAASVQLGKALNDPVTGVTALRRVGVMLTDQQEAQIKSFMAVGDTASAQKVILGELETEFGGLARAAGETLAGKLDILKNKFGNVQESIGTAILPSLTLLADKLIQVLNKPEVQAAIQSLSDWFATALPKAIEGGTALLNDLSENGITGVLRQAQAWSNDPGTQAMLKQVGAQLGQGIVGGVKDAAASSPVWAGIAVDIGKAALPALTGIAKGLGLGFFEGLLEGIGISPDMSAKIAKFLMARPGPEAWGALGGVLGFQSGGVVPGLTGMPQLAVVHGGETILPAGTPGGSFTFVYAPVVSLADEREAAQRLMPVLDRWYQGVKSRRG